MFQMFNSFLKIQSVANKLTKPREECKDILQEKQAGCIIKLANES
jgi:hypothetical protein